MSHRRLAAALAAVMLLGATASAQAHAPFVMAGSGLPEGCVAKEVVWKSGEVSCRYGTTAGGLFGEAAAGAGKTMEKKRLDGTRLDRGVRVIVIDGIDDLFRFLTKEKSTRNQASRTSSSPGRSPAQREMQVQQQRAAEQRMNRVPPKQKKGEPSLPWYVIVVPR